MRHFLAFIVEALPLDQVTVAIHGDVMGRMAESDLYPLWRPAEVDHSACGKVTKNVQLMTPFYTTSPDHLSDA